MRQRSFIALVCALPLAAAAAAAQETADYHLTLETALDLARARAPQLLAAQATADVARARLAGLPRWLPDNPSIDAEAGPRWSGGDRTADFAVGLNQPLDLSGRGAARRALGRADVDVATARADETARALLRRVALAFLDVLRGDERLRIARDHARLAADVLHVAERRHANGDVAVLDVDVTALALADARATALAEEAARAAAVGTLRQALDLEPDRAVFVTGDLRDRRRGELDALLDKAFERSDLRVLTAAVRHAEAEGQIGRAAAWPDVGVRLSYGQDDGDDIARAGLTLGLPIVARGQTARATAAVHAQQARAALAARQRAVQTEIRTAFDSFRLLEEAVQTMERDGLPRLAQQRRAGTAQL